ncbi:hypothetical protein ACGF0J_02940 [Nonomuraea sp. NPDC047897]|uniref:hypothetical protein n=1 Tax=Nonomuraea sp. NPDC047897 TaxID=3364346 RepID=UPI0037198547
MIPYRPRQTRSLGVTRLGGWNVKVIGITAEDDLPDDFEVEAGLQAAERELPEQGGIAFVVVHRAIEALWVYVCRWQADALYQRLWRGEPGGTGLRRVPPDGPAACVWGLLAIDHERRAWIEHVLARPHDPDFTGYLAADPWPSPPDHEPA